MVFGGNGKYWSGSIFSIFLVCRILQCTLIKLEYFILYYIESHFNRIFWQGWNEVIILMYEPEKLYQHGA
jgi:hypothetical protein